MVYVQSGCIPMIYILSSFRRQAAAKNRVRWEAQTMKPFTTFRQQPTTSTTSSAAVREYRRDRQHLFPLDAYKAATAVGGSVRAYCGIVQEVRQSNPADVEEVAEAGVEDCVTCVDLWLGRQRVRL